jgi:hypothetical protein
MYGATMLHGTFPVSQYIVREAKNNFKPCYMDECLHEYVGFFNFFLRQELKLDGVYPQCMGDGKGEKMLTVKYHQDKDRATLDCLCRQVVLYIHPITISGSCASLSVNMSLTFLFALV